MQWHQLLVSISSRAVSCPAGIHVMLPSSAITHESISVVSMLIVTDPSSIRVSGLNQVIVHFIRHAVWCRRLGRFSTATDCISIPQLANNCTHLFIHTALHCQLVVCMLQLMFQALHLLLQVQCTCRIACRRDGPLISQRCLHTARCSRFASTSLHAKCPATMSASFSEMSGMSIRALLNTSVA